MHVHVCAHVCARVRVGQRSTLGSVPQQAFPLPFRQHLSLGGQEIPDSHWLVGQSPQRSSCLHLLAEGYNHAPPHPSFDVGADGWTWVLTLYVLPEQAICLA